MSQAARLPQETPEALRFRQLWLDRYRDGAPPAKARINETIDTLLSHRSIRAHLPTPLPEGALELAISAAQSASSSSNLQAWSVIAVDDPDLKARLNVLADNQRHIASAPLLLIWLVDLSRLRGLAKDGLPTDGLDYFESFLIGVVDTVLAAQNATTAFESLGLGTCYIGSMRNHPEEVAAALGLPPEVFALFGMTVGVPDPAAGASVKPKLPQSAVLSRNGYAPTTASDLQGYNGTLRAFQAEQGMKVVDWTELAAQRVAMVQALRNRDKLLQALKSLGFGLK